MNRVHNRIETPDWIAIRKGCAKMDTPQLSREQFHAEVEKRADYLSMEEGTSAETSFLDWLEAEWQIRDEYDITDKKR